MNPPKPMNCTVYKCARKADTYLFVASGTDKSTLPAALLATLGVLDEVLEFDLHPGRTLARAAAPNVITGIESRGYYLQLPPATEPVAGGFAV